ncbi:MAG: flagellar biosynthesis protein FliQ [Caldicoprobacter oshimai]|uniref:Flagellar biosynthetic protein FliQ n=1 Tax=Caldicoprobacter faecalis TaxID=937334 RepID=A0A1I5RMW9_9FIRM|nr:flagellar biosynthesis protein FliQ [Caldicoprobacter faecalis]PZN10610.1 MAG: flagellar biosynthetic protein FliQ [Caldicoprobacter oshimai]SFP59843.1 flagellar biosynthetic protein FliQ [Caldicoprobacter faecalis]
MSQREIITLAQQAIYTGILLSAPMLGLGLVVGLVVAIFQAITQINEHTLVFIPKILAVAVALIIFGPWLLETIVNFTLKLYNSINTILGL